MGPLAAENQVKKLVDVGHLDAKIISLPGKPQPIHDAAGFKITRRE
mgnify:FL=1